jgi:cytochrome c oxidase subunit 4
MADHTISLRTYFAVFFALLLLLAATIGVSYIDLGPFNFAMAMTIATAKALLVVVYFMHLRFSRNLIRLFAAAGFVWMGVLIGGTLNDYYSRGWLGEQSREVELDDRSESYDRRPQAPVR